MRSLAIIWLRYLHVCMYRHSSPRVQPYRYTAGRWHMRPYSKMEVEGSQPLICFPLHMAWHPNGIRETWRLWLKERRMRVRQYNTTRPRWSTQLCVSKKSCKEWARSKDGRDSVSISYNSLMSFYSGVSQTYTPCRWVDVHYSCICVCMYVWMYIERLR